MTNWNKNNTPITVSIRGKAVHLLKSEVLFCSFRDIGERNRLEEEARLIQAKLIQANKMTSLGTLVSGIAHEINNPNNFIMVNAQMVTEAWTDVLRMLNEYYRDHGDFTLGGVPFSEMRYIMPRLLSAISDGSGRINTIIDNLRNFARQDRASLDKTVDVNHAITASAMILNSQIKKYTDNFRVDPGSDLPPVKGSSQQLEQVIINLVMNALQSLQGRDKEVVVSSSFDPGSGSIFIRVRDEGVGMSQDVLDHITEPFFTTRLEEGGTGLGLFISYSIIKDHQGTLKFESEPGKGTVACVALPALTVPAERNLHAADDLS
jgi:C4-dicarboxylate-specific signal transduction histidine kinase